MNTLCPTGSLGNYQHLVARKVKPEKPRRPRLVVCIFGSEWSESASALRSQMRLAMRTCKSKRFGVRAVEVEHVFIMAGLPLVPGCRLSRKQCLRTGVTLGVAIMLRKRNHSSPLICVLKKSQVRTKARADALREMFRAAGILLGKLVQLS